MGFIGYLTATFERMQAREAFEVYITDSIYYRGQNKTISKRYYDLMHRKPSISREAAEDIAQQVISRLHEDK